MRKLILYLAIACFLMLPLLAFTIRYYPGALNFMEPVLCRSGWQLESGTTEQGSYMRCQSGDVSDDALGKMIIITSGFPILSVLLFVVWLRMKLRR
jgi:hypothetical protein